MINDPIFLTYLAKSLGFTTINYYSQAVTFTMDLAALSYFLEALVSTEFNERKKL